MNKKQNNQALLKNIDELISTNDSLATADINDLFSLESMSDVAVAESELSTILVDTNNVVDGGLDQQVQSVALSNASELLKTNFSPVSMLKAHGISLENFDDEFIQEAKILTTASNLMAGQSNELTRAIYSIFSPVAVGVRSRANIKYKRVFIKGEQLHTDGTPIAADDRELYTILDNGLSDVNLRLVAVNGAANADLLVDPAIIPPTAIIRDDEEIEVLPIKFDEQVDYIGLSQSAGVTSVGKKNRTEVIDRNPRLQAIYVKAGDDIIRFNTMGNNSNLFNDVKNGSTNDLKLSFKGDLMLDNRSTDFDGADLVTLADIKAKNLTVKVRARASGEMHRQTAQGGVYFNGLEVISIIDELGSEIPLDDAAVAGIVEAINDAEGIGYSVDARVTNSNLTHRPTVFDIDHHVEPLTVSVQAACGIESPVNRKFSSEKLAILNSGALYDKAHAVVKKLREECALIEEYNANTNYGTFNNLYGIGGSLVKATHHKIEIDLAQDLNSVSHSMLRRDLQAMLYMSAQELGIQLWLKSGLGKVSGAVYAGQQVRPVFTMLVDERIAANMVDYSREEKSKLFDIEFVSIPSDELINTGYGTFRFETNTNEDVSILDFGWCANGTDLVYNAPVPVGTGVMNVVQLHPVYELHVNTPVIGELAILGWLEALGCPGCGS